jgi:NADPH-dependent F420 reductase
MSRTIAIIGGTGPEGKGLAARWARAGETIIVGSRDAKRAEDVAAQIVGETGGRAAGMENLVAAAAADVVVLTVPFVGLATLLKDLKPAIRPGTIVIDATVPLASGVGGRPTRMIGVWQGSAAQQTAELLAGIPVVAAFQNLSAELLQGTNLVECDVIVCGDDAAARTVASELAEKIPGVRALNGGALENARIVEQVTALLIGLNIRYKVHHAGLRITGLPIS